MLHRPDPPLLRDIDIEVPLVDDNFLCDHRGLLGEIPQYLPCNMPGQQKGCCQEFSPPPFPQYYRKAHKNATGGAPDMPCCRTESMVWCIILGWRNGPD